MNNSAKHNDSERGSAGAKFIMVFVVLVLVAHAGFNYVPVAYDAESFKTEMQTAVVQGLALPGKLNPVENVKGRIWKSGQINGVPADAVYDVKQTGNVITAHVSFVRQVNILPFGIYKYSYVFDHTATPTGFLLKQ